jgi:hypothetical protein
MRVRWLMTEVKDPDVIAEALALIDRGLGEMQQRELVTTSEVADLLLDVRLLLATASVDAEPEVAFQN